MTQQTSEVVAQGNRVLAFLMDDDCPFELMSDESAMAPYKFFAEDWKNKAEWTAKYTFPASDKEFKAQMMQVDRGDGVKVQHARKRNPALWSSNPFVYVGVRRKSQPQLAVSAAAGGS